MIITAKLRPAFTAAFFAAFLTHLAAAQVTIGPGHPYAPANASETAEVANNYVDPADFPYLGNGNYFDPNQFTVQVQQFRTPDSSNVQMNDFVLYYAHPQFGDVQDSGASITLGAAVVEWNADPVNGHGNAVGQVVWTSTSGNTTVLAHAYQTDPARHTPDWSRYTFDTSGLVLDPAKTYGFLAIQAQTGYPGDTASGDVGIVFGPSGYLPTWTFNAANTHFTRNYAEALDPVPFWSSSGTQNSLAFTATFTPSAPTSIQSWRQKWYGTTANTGNAADTADPYSKGMQNLATFALLGANQDPSLASITQFPQSQRSSGNLLCSFTEPPGVSGVTYGAEWSATLQSDWQPIPDTGNAPLHIFSVPMGSNTKLFLRLRVTEQ